MPCSIGLYTGYLPITVYLDKLHHCSSYSQGWLFPLSSTFLSTSYIDTSNRFCIQTDFQIHEKVNNLENYSIDRLRGEYIAAQNIDIHTIHIYETSSNRYYLVLLSYKLHRSGSL